MHRRTDSLSLTPATLSEVGRSLSQLGEFNAGETLFAWYRGCNNDHLRATFELIVKAALPHLRKQVQALEAIVGEEGQLGKPDESASTNDHPKKELAAQPSGLQRNSRGKISLDAKIDQKNEQDYANDPTSWERYLSKRVVLTEKGYERAAATISKRTHQKITPEHVKAMCNLVDMRQAAKQAEQEPRVFVQSSYCRLRRIDPETNFAYSANSPIPDQSRISPLDMMIFGAWSGRRMVEDKIVRIFRTYGFELPEQDPRSMGKEICYVLKEVLYGELKEREIPPKKETTQTKTPTVKKERRRDPTTITISPRASSPGYEPPEKKKTRGEEPPPLYEHCANKIVGLEDTVKATFPPTNGSYTLTPSQIKQYSKMLSRADVARMARATSDEIELVYIRDRANKKGTWSRSPRPSQIHLLDALHYLLASELEDKKKFGELKIHGISAASVEAAREELMRIESGLAGKVSYATCDRLRPQQVADVCAKDISSLRRELLGNTDMRKLIEYDVRMDTLSKPRLAGVLAAKGAMLRLTPEQSRTAIILLGYEDGKAPALPW